MITTRDEKYIAFCDKLRAYVEEHKHFPVRHTALNNQIRYIRKKIHAGTLEDWKQKMFEQIANSRDLTLHTGGRKKMPPLPSA